jgi:hypothetical protein
MLAGVQLFGTYHFGLGGSGTRTCPPPRHVGHVFSPFPPQLTQAPGGRFLVHGEQATLPVPLHLVHVAQAIASFLQPSLRLSTDARLFSATTCRVVPLVCEAVGTTNLCMSRSPALIGSAEPRARANGPTLTCPDCETRREFVRVPYESQLAPNRAWHSLCGWQAICGNCGELFSPPA